MTQALDFIFVKTNQSFFGRAAACMAAILLAFVVLAWILMGLNTPAQASAGEIFCVTLAGGAYPGCDQVFISIQDAVDAAAGGEEIRIGAGVYSDIHYRNALTQVVYISRELTIRGGYSADFSAREIDLYPATIDAGGQGRGLVIVGDISPTIEGLYVTGGDASGLGGFSGDPLNFDSGGGIYAVSAASTISRCTVISNVASRLGRGFGGGLYHQGVGRLFGNIFENNAGSLADTGGGGAVYFKSADGSILHNNKFISNTASAAGDGSGGGLFCYMSDLELVGNTLRENTGSSSSSSWGNGGGMYAYFSDLAMIENGFWGNRGGVEYSAFGGGLYLYGGESTLERNWFVNNSASQRVGYTGIGGGGYVYDASAITLINNIIADNYAYHHGSGFYIKGTESKRTNVRLLHNTLADNRGATSALYFQDYVTGVTTNTIFANNSDGGLRVGATSTATLRGTLWYGNDSATLGDGTILSSTNVYSAPNFVDPENWNYHLAAGSAAINSGVDSGVFVDIDGDSRPAKDYDLGADEFWNVIYLPLLQRSY